MDATSEHLPVQGSCVGFEIHSALPFQTARHGGGTPLAVSAVDHLVVEGESLLTWRARPDNPFEGRLLAMNSRYAFWTNDAGWFVVDPHVPSIEMTSGPMTLRRELRLFGVPATLCAVGRGDVSIHAAAADVGGRGVLLAGPSRYGKTTLAAAFARAGHRLLSEDSTRVAAGRSVLVFPGPAALRLRPEVAAALPIRGTRSVPGNNGRVQLLIDPTSRGSGAGVVLRAILILRRTDDRIALERIVPTNAIADLLALSFHLPTSSSRAETFGRIADVVAAVPVFNLYRPMTIESMGEVVGRVEDLLAGEA